MLCILQVFDVDVDDCIFDREVDCIIGKKGSRFPSPFCKKVDLQDHASFLLYTCRTVPGKCFQLLTCLSMGERVMTDLAGCSQCMCLP